MKIIERTGRALCQGLLQPLLAFRHLSRRRESQKQMRLLQRGLEACYNGVVIVDTQATDLPITYVNSAFERITGYSIEEVVGRNCRFLQGSEQDQPELQKIREAIKKQQEAHVVLKNFRKDGSAFWNNLYIAPVPGEDGVTITHFIGVLDDISEQKKYEADLAYSASHDVLTGLLNRSLLEDRVRQACRMAQRYSRRMAVVFLDLDGFKPINDTRGHPVGDQILVEVASRVESQVRSCDSVARLGGDEFVLLLTDLEQEEDALAIVERVLGWVAQPYYIDGEELRITASAGIRWSMGDSENATELIHQADLAMQEVKKQGCNNYQWYTDDLNQKAGEGVSLRTALQSAIEQGSLQLCYQPQIDAASNRVTGFEALCRWQHPDLGLVPPEQFIQVAENTGQIIPLSKWVLETACRDNQMLCAQGLSKYLVAVNISPIHFQRSDFVDTIKGILCATGHPPEFLELELTETILFNDPNKAISTLRELKALGVRLSIDDFGTGFSSLNYLKLLPVDKIKIDRSFVKDIVSDSRDAAITLGIISMAHHLNLKVTVEGIETEAQRAFLEKSHCDEFQGYMFAKPMPLEQLTSFLQEHRDQSLKRSGTGKNQKTLLLVDDEENILRALARVLRREGYNVLQATSAQQAFALLAMHEVQVIVSDQRMPEMTGTEFFYQVKKLYPHTVRIILSGYTDLKSVTETVNHGAIYKFLTKPWDDDILRASIAQAFDRYSKSRG